jgi:hypothetical protein
MPMVRSHAVRSPEDSNSTIHLVCVVADDKVTLSLEGEE